MQKYFVSELYPHAVFTAGILRNDIEDTLLHSAYRSIDLTVTKKGVLNKIGLYYKALRLSQQVKPNDIIFFHFPLRSRVIRFFHLLSIKKKCKTIAYIHDFEGLRDQNTTLLKAEINQLKKFDCIIAQNKAMKEFITAHISNIEVIVLEMYDYLHLQPKQQTNLTLPNEICFAGNLSKAPFISKLNLFPGLLFYIYGEHTGTITGKNIQLMDKVDPRILPDVIKGSFGLVWDGSSIETGEGFGEYLKYNTPHKLSLYLAAGLPVIVWNQSAMADWVIKNEVGIAVSSLSEIEQRINEITESQYLVLQQQILPIKEKIRKGFYLQQALTAVESNMSDTQKL